MKSEPELVAECVEAYSAFVVHEARGQGEKYQGRTADEILSAEFPLYNSNRYQTREYHRIFSMVVEVAEAGILQVLLASGAATICAREGCSTPVKSRGAKTCSKECGQEWRYNRKRKELENNAMRREEIRAKLGISAAEHMRRLYNAGLTIEEIYETTGIRRGEIRRTLRECGHSIPDARTR